VRNMRRLAAMAIGLLAVLGIAACGSSSSSSSSNSSGSSSSPAAASSSSGGSGISGATVIGAGSTFAAPLYGQEGSSFKSAKGVTVNYGSLGSGAGVAQFTAKTVDYGASDVFLTTSELAAASKNGKPMDIPVAFGAVAPAFNLPGIKSLKLDGPTLADIFLGKITKWNDPAIAKFNPGVKLPSESITVIHRSDSSGTTADFTQFLAAVSPQWKSQVGASKEVKWPTGTGGKGNEGVAAALKQTPGGLGYLELAYVVQNNYPTISMKNKSGNFITASLQSTSAAAAGKFAIPADLRVDTIDSPGAEAYPIASPTFALIYQDPCKAGVPGGATAAKATIDFLKFIDSSQGQGIAKQLFYGPLPSTLLTKAQAALGTVTCNGQPIS
jgi:phosphate transport system substrate-binding protein